MTRNLGDMGRMKRCQNLPAASSFPQLQRTIQPWRSIAQSFRRTPHHVIVIIKDNKDYIRAPYYSYYTTITGWGVLLIDAIDIWWAPKSTLFTDLEP